MKKVLVSLILISILVLPTVVSAQGWIDRLFGTGGSAPTEAPETDVMIILDSLTDWMFAILLVIAAIFIIIAAFNFVTAAGDPEKTKTARNYVLYALIGVLVGFAAKGLVMLVRRIVAPAMQ